MRRVVLALLLALLQGCLVRHETEEVAPGWEVVTEISQIPEAGGYHPSLWRHSKHVHVQVDIDTYSVERVDEQCVAWYGLDSRGFYIACGDRQPFLLQADPQMRTGVKVTGGQLTLDSFSTPVATARAAALRQPALTDAWKPVMLIRGQ
ncbi:MAG TPA: hypothetical protein VFN10_04970 [Thermoanaerobaculia bacterium]|nr:hypothetical protein [Thermoanaerobaculia bacterium]